VSIGTADLITAINSAWDASSLNALFQTSWTVAQRSRFPVLEDQEAAPGHPLPYCVMEVERPRTTNRMSARSGTREIREVVVRFNIHASEIVGDSRSSKQIAKDLAEEVIKIFGGHPTTNPTLVISLDNGGSLAVRLENEFGTRTDTGYYQWVVEYLFRVDVPVAQSA
jgi:hypothetical protein